MVDFLSNSWQERIREAGADDDRPYLKYAALLEAKSDPRGEYIRVCCSLESGRDYFNGGIPLTDVRREELERRDETLFLTHSAEWDRPFKEMGVTPLYDRGVVSGVTSSAKNLLRQVTAPARMWIGEEPLLGQLLREHPSIRDVTVTDVTDDEAKALAKLPSLVDVQSLSFQEGCLSAKGVSALGNAPCLRHLKHLAFDNNSIGPFINDGRDDDPMLRLGLSKLRGLRTLTISNNAIDDGQVAILARSPVVMNLEVLALENNRISDAGVTALAKSPQLKELTGLHLSGNAVGEQGASVLADSAAFRRLEWVKLKGNPITVETLEKVNQSLEDRRTLREQQETIIKDSLAKAKALGLPSK